LDGRRASAVLQRTLPQCRLLKIDADENLTLLVDQSRSQLLLPVTPGDTGPSSVQSLSAMLAVFAARAIAAARWRCG
jgi:hypothetical protein